MTVTSHSLGGNAQYQPASELLWRESIDNSSLTLTALWLIGVDIQLTLSVFRSYTYNDYGIGHRTNILLLNV